MANATKNDNSAWKITGQKLNVSNSQGVTGQKVTLATAGTYVDRDIEIEAPVVTVDVADVSDVKSELAFGEQTTIPAGMIDAPITIKHKDSQVGTVVAANETVNVAVNNVKNADGTYHIEGTKEIGITSTVAGYIDSENGTMTAGSATAAGSIVESTLSSTKVAPAPDAQTVTVGAGYYPEARTITIDGMADQPASFTNVAADGQEYASHQGPVLTSGGYLYINAGYTANQKISLADLVPDEASAPEVIEAGMLNTVVAYDSNGSKITGSIVEQTTNEAAIQRNGKDVTVAAGYYKNGGSLEIPTMPVIAAVDITAEDGEVVIPADKLNLTEQKVAVTSGAAAIKAAATVEVTAGEVKSYTEKNGAYEVVIPVTAAGTATASTTTTGRAIVGTTNDSFTINHGNDVTISIAKATHSNVITAEATAASATSTQNVTAGSGVDLGGILTVAPTSGEYLTLTPTLAAEAGKVVSDAKNTTTAAGYCAADCVVDADQKETAVSVTKSQGADKYIAVYGGIYTLG